jgi:competence protein ComEA
MVKEFLNNYFGFNRQQRNGLLVLLCISAFLLIVRVTYPSFMKRGEVEIMNLPFGNTDTIKGAEMNASSDLFFFDPNTASKEDLVRLGLKEKTAVTLIKYRKKNRFESAEELMNVFGVSARLFEKLKPYIQIPSEEKLQLQVSVTKQSTPTIQIKNVELNGADSTQLLTLPGIGPVFAHRIIKYRTLLGGYVLKDQLKEVYGLKQETYDLASPHVTVDASLAKKINLNSDDFKTVNRHPYISYELTKALFNKKGKQALDPKKVQEIVGNDSLYQRLLPYLAY